MALTAAGAAVTERHRLDQVRLRTTATRNLIAVWSLFDPLNISKSWATIEPIIVALAIARQPLSSTLTARYLDTFRQVEGVGSPVARTLAPRLTPDDLIPNLRIVGPGNAQRLNRLGRRPSVIARTTFTNVEGEVARQVLNGGRQTLLDDLRNDRQALAYYRVTDGNPCSFCALLAGRGAVYKSAETAVAGKEWSDVVGGYRAHRACGCTAEPIYDHDSAPTPSAARYAALYDEAAAAVPRSTPDWSAAVRREFRRRHDAAH